MTFNINVKGAGVLRVGIVAVGPINAPADDDFNFRFFIDDLNKIAVMGGHDRHRTLREGGVSKA